MFRSIFSAVKITQRSNEYILLGHAVWPAGGPPSRAEQWPVLILRDARRGDVLIQVGFELGYAWRFMFLAALFM